MDQAVIGIFDYLVSLWEGLFSSPISSLNGVQIGVLVLVYLLLWQVLKVLFKTSKSGAKVVSKVAKKVLFSFSPKARASKMVCIHCGRTLDKCVCPSNKNLSYSKRIKKQKLEIKAAKLSAKIGK